MQAADHGHGCGCAAPMLGMPQLRPHAGAGGGAAGHSIVTCMEDCDLRQVNRALWGEITRLRTKQKELETEQAASRAQDRLGQRVGPAQNISSDGQAVQPGSVAISAKEFEGFSKQQKDLTTANARIDKLLKLQIQLNHKYDRERKATETLAATVQQLTAANADLQAKVGAGQKHVLHLQKLNARAKATNSPARKNAVAYTAEIKLDKCQKKLRRALAEKQQLHQMYNELTRHHAVSQTELQALDPKFFEELEDLKYAVHQTNRLNAAFNAALHSAAARLGVPYDSIAPDTRLLLSQTTWAT